MTAVATAPTEPILFSREQVRELFQLQQTVRAANGHYITDPITRRASLACELFTLLVLTSEMIGAGQEEQLSSINPSPRAHWRTLARHFGPAVSAADIIAELERFVTVPAFAADAIREFFTVTAS